MMATTILSTPENTLGERVHELYVQLRDKVETAGNIGRFIVLDVESGDYEIDDEGIESSRRLLARHPGAILYALRLGYKAVASFSGGLERTTAL